MTNLRERRNPAEMEVPMSLAVVILAAGKSTRFKSRIPKVLHPLAGKPMLAYSLELATQLSPTPPVIVVGPETEAEIQAWVGDQARCVVQKKRLGTGHAVQQAQPLLEGSAAQVLVLYGDMPLLRLETLRQLTTRHAAAGSGITLLSVERENPYGFGRLVRDAERRIRAIVEEVEATPEIAAIRELNVGIYTFAADFLWSQLAQVKPSPRKGEYYLTDLIALAADAGLTVESVPLSDPEEGLGINTRVQFALAAAALRRRINEQWMLAGVTLVDPERTYIEAGVTLGQDTVIHPDTHLRGRTTIGEECELGPNSVLVDATLGNRCRVTASFVEGATMEDESDVGPFSHLRKGAHICQGAHVGNFGEMKNSTLGPQSKMGHFSYLGDTTVGTGVNIGAGTITCNYDGVRKHPTEIEDGVFIGSDTLLVAPVRIGKEARTGAGSVVTHDVPSGTLAYGVPARIRSPHPLSEAAPPAEEEGVPDAERNGKG